MKATMKPYQRPLLSLFNIQLYAPSCLDVNTSDVEEVEEGEVGAPPRPDEDTYGNLYSDKGLW